MKTAHIAGMLVLLTFGFSNAMACSSCGCTTKSTSTCNDSQQAQLTDIIQTAQDAGQFKTLVAALEAADLVGALQGTGPLYRLCPNGQGLRCAA